MQSQGGRGARDLRVSGLDPVPIQVQVLASVDWVAGLEGAAASDPEDARKVAVCVAVCALPWGR